MDPLAEAIAIEKAARTARDNDDEFALLACIEKASEAVLLAADARANHTDDGTPVATSRRAQLYYDHTDCRAYACACRNHLRTLLERRRDARI